MMIEMDHEQGWSVVETWRLCRRRLFPLARKSGVRIPSVRVSYRKTCVKRPSASVWERDGIMGIIGDLTSPGFALYALKVDVTSFHSRTSFCFIQVT